MAGVWADDRQLLGVCPGGSEAELEEARATALGLAGRHLRWVVGTKVLEAPQELTPVVLGKIGGGRVARGRIRASVREGLGAGVRERIGAGVRGTHTPRTRTSGKWVTMRPRSVVSLV